MVNNDIPSPGASNSPKPASSGKGTNPQAEAKTPSRLGKYPPTAAGRRKLLCAAAKFAYDLAQGLSPEETGCIGALHQGRYRLDLQVSDSNMPHIWVCYYHFKSVEALAPKLADLYSRVKKTGRVGRQLCVGLTRALFVLQVLGLRAGDPAAVKYCPDFGPDVMKDFNAEIGALVATMPKLTPYKDKPRAQKDENQRAIDCIQTFVRIASAPKSPHHDLLQEGNELYRKAAARRKPMEAKKTSDGNHETKV